jgi:mono/diheme cytochrome c family protein
MADIFAFLYLVRYLDQPGDVDRGELLFRQKGCLRCHEVKGSGGKSGPDIAGVSFADTPISWVRTLWNHAAQPEVAKALPSQAKLQGDDVDDMLAFVRSAGTGQRQEGILFPADLTHGEQVFKRQGCVECHAHWLAGRPSVSWPRSVPELAGVMWNHAPQLQILKKTHPRLALGLEGKEAADLIAYLYTLRSLDPPGDRARGREVYERKNCVLCHGPAALGTEQAPSLRKLRGSFTPIFIAETLWEHGPKIFEQMAKRGVSWPKMDTQEMDDLLAFLNSD